MEGALTTPVKDLSLRRIQTGILLDLQRIRQSIEARVEQMLREQGLEVTPAQANVLMALIEAREPRTARQLARDLRVSDVTMGRFVRALHEGGWIDRRRDPSDSRAILVRPTPRAREALPRFIAVSNALADGSFAGFSREEVERFGQMMESVRGNLEDQLSQGDS